MPKPPTLNRRYDHLKNLTLSDLSRFGLLQPGYQTTGVIRWTHYATGAETGKVEAVVCVTPQRGYVELSYSRQGSPPLRSLIDLVQQPSNLGRGVVWYFVCPITGHRCRTLYLTDAGFASRKALPGMLYESQTYSRHSRRIAKVQGPEIWLDRAFAELYKPYAKRHYRGKPTPKLRRILRLETMTSGVRPIDVKRYTSGRK